jgi:hypothetical protein
MVVRAGGYRAMIRVAGVEVGWKVIWWKPAWVSHVVVRHGGPHRSTAPMTTPTPYAGPAPDSTARRFLPARVL